jgi:hypothetical protein
LGFPRLKMRRRGDGIGCSVEMIERKIYLVQGHKVMLDSDLAQLYKVETRTLIQAVKRNVNRFSSDVMFQLSYQEGQV